MKTFVAKRRTHWCVPAIGILVLLASANHGYCQVKLSPAFEKTDAVAQPPDGKLSITIHPAASPDPMLRYRLWPAPEDRRQRAAMVAVNRSLLLLARVPTSAKRDFLDRYDQWIQLPISELPVAEAKSSCQAFQSAIKVLRTGENWMGLQYDLGWDTMSTTEKAGTLLPEYQEMRDLARLLCLRARIAVAEGRWDDAVDDLRLGFRLSEVASHSTDTLLSRLIGIAISEVLLDTIEAMVQIPDCPNLYWALAAIPVDHLFDLRDAIEYESTLVHHVGAITDHPKLGNEIIGEEKALIRLKEFGGAFASLAVAAPASSGGQTWNEMSVGIEIMMMVRPSRELLASSPDWKDRVNELSDAEAVLRASDLELSRIRHRWLAWALLPPELWGDYLDERTDALKATGDAKTLGGRLARVLLPAVRVATTVGLRVKQQHHRLVTVEALRMHAATTGALPDDIRKLLPFPAWQDPVSRQPFVYEQTSKTEATLTREKTPRKQEGITLVVKLEAAQ